MEIKTLPGRTLSKLASEGILPGYEPHLPERANKLFLTLRQEVRESGVEVSAVEGAWRVFKQMGLAIHAADIERAVQQLEEECLPAVEMVLGASLALATLRDAGYTLCIVSSAGYPPFVELALEKLGLRAFFSEIVTSAGEGMYKSNPELFRRAVARLGASPQEGVHVGDHAVYDVRAAKAAGLATVWFAAQARRTAELHGVTWNEAAQAGSEADAIITDLRDLPNAIESLKEGR